MRGYADGGHGQSTAVPLEGYGAPLSSGGPRTGNGRVHDRRVQVRRAQGTGCSAFLHREGSLRDRFLPQGAVNIVSVLAVGFSWMPPAMLPWEKLGLGVLVGRRITARGRPGSPQPE